MPPYSVGYGTPRKPNSDSFFIKESGMWSSASILLAIGPISLFAKSRANS